MSVWTLGTGATAKSWVSPCGITHRAALRRVVWIVRSFIAVRLLLGCAVFAIAGFFAVRFPNTPGTTTGSLVSTVAIALPAFFAFFRRFGVRRSVPVLLALSFLGFAVELMGVVTGFPYGEFSYAEKLGPRIGGLVPSTLPLSWVPLVLGAVAATERVERPDSRLRWLSWGVAAAVLLVAFDGVLDPGAAHLGFWVWPTGGPYYGVPLSNYAGWLLSSLAASALLLALAPWGQTQPRAGMLDSTLISLAFWSAVNAVADITVPALLGVALFAFMLWRRIVLQLTLSV